MNHTMLVLVVMAMMIITAYSEGVSPSQACRDLPDFKFCDARLSISERVKDLISQLSVAEKVGLMGDNTTGVARLGIPKFSWWTEALHGANAKCYRSSTGAPRCPTTFPAGINMGASFNMPLVKNVGEVISDEMRAAYNLAIHNTGTKNFVDPVGPIVWSPNINIYRDPRWGRGQETPGEDPVLTGKYAAAMVQGLQESRDPRYYKLISTAKHFVAYSLESYAGVDRTQFNATVTPQDMTQTYMPAFEAAIKDGHAAGVMCSYNEVNGVPACASKELLQSTLRDKWGFDGYVTGDCWAIGAMIEGHHYVKTEAEAAAAALAAGTDTDCWVDGWYYQVKIHNIYQDHLQEALQQNLVTEAMIDQALTRLFTIQMKAGMFDPLEMLPYGHLDETSLGAPEHRLLARQMARESLILLKNDKQMLPFTLDERPSSTAAKLKVAVIGPHAAATEALTSNYHGELGKVVSVLEALQNTAGMTVTYSAGCSSVTDSSTAGVADAAAQAAAADVAVVVVGIDQTVELEGQDRVSLALPGAQNELIAAVLAKQPHTVVVVINGGMVGMETINQAPAVIEAFYPGEEGGNAIVDVLVGRYNPSGRLPVTIYPVNFPDTANFFNYDMRKAPGLTYRFHQHQPMYEFGFGLSYTTFTYEIPRGHQAVRAQLDAAATFSVTVTNTGARAGHVSVLGFISLLATDSAPFYGHLNSDHSRTLADAQCPLRQLFDFQKIFLAPGQQRTLSFTVTPASALCVDAKGNKIARRGIYSVTLGEARATLLVM